MSFDLPDGWKMVKLGEVCETNVASYSNNDSWDYVNYLDTGNITENNVEAIQFIDLGKNNLPSRARRKVKDGDIVYSTVRPIQKHYGIINKALKNMLVSTGFTTIRANINKAYTPFIYCHLIQDHIVQGLQAIAEQTVSTYPAIKSSHIESIEIPFPPLSEQKAIADTLSCLDNKIELNNRINKILEETAQTIFKRWFVDFEFPNEDGQPYKSNGGTMVDSELGEIPQGWRVGALGEYVDSIDNRGKTPKLELESTDYPIIDVRALSGTSRIINYKNCTKYVNEDTYKNWFRSGHPKELDTLISTVGSLAEMKMFYGKIGCIAQNVVAFRSKNISPYYIYQYLKNIKDDLISYNIGSVQPSIKVTHIIKHNLILPTATLLIEYDALVSGISKQIYINSIENQTLTAIRDALLPKLMSGEIRVPITEQD